MTEREFDRKVEEMAARFEQRIEASADRLEKGVNADTMKAGYFILPSKQFR